MKDDGGTEVDIKYVPTKDVYELKETKETQGINYGGSSNDNMASDFSTPQSHAINNGSSVISNSVIDCVLESALSVIIDYNLLVYKSLLLFINQASILIEDTMVIRVEDFRSLLSREDLQWVSRVCCLPCAGR